MLDIYADSAQSIAIANPVSLGPNGEEPNIFYSGSARIVGNASNGDQVFDRDPVGGEATLGNFEGYDSVLIYAVSDFVKAENGKFYRSLLNDNQGNDPTLLPNDNQYWEEVRFLGVYNARIAYSIGQVVQTNAGYMWRSLTNSNLGNSPDSDNGTNWAAVFNYARTPELANVIPHTGGGALTGLRINELRDGGAYTLPLANAVQVNQTITIDLPERYKTFEPTITASGADNIISSTGSDTSIQYDAVSFGKITLTSDGVGNWSL
ncbi:MAG: hypothetical protein HRU12_24875 [Phaeodactylibacter sp.]|nr:hypothetical protein [Phaeodactylibacter sp.]